MADGFLIPVLNVEKMDNMLSKDTTLQNVIGKTIDKIIILSEDRTDKFQFNFSDGSKLILTANTSGYDIESQDIDVEFYE